MHVNSVLYSLVYGFVDCLTNSVKFCNMIQCLLGTNHKNPKSSVEIEHTNYFNTKINHVLKVIPADMLLGCVLIDLKCWDEVYYCGLGIVPMQRSPLF